MPGTLDAIDRIAPRTRPAESVAGYHRWTDLLFIHWQVPVEMLTPLLPPRLTLDTWEGNAFVGLVPFYMSGVRPWWAPAVPGISNFCETNVRTYVHFDGNAPGVWFLSLDAAKSLAVRLGRRFWHLSYFKAQMDYERKGTQIRYRSNRQWPEPSAAQAEIVAEIGEPLQNGSAQPGSAVPDTLEYFLAERYYLYAASPDGRLLRGQVHHRPYPLRTVRVTHLEQTLLPAAGVNPPEPHCHTLFSDGVDVEIFPLRVV